MLTLTFSPPAALNSNAVSDSGHDWDPQVTTDGSGNWVAVWESTENVGGIGMDGDILFSRSTDNGQNWTPPAALNSNAVSDSEQDWDPQVTTDGSGNWVAVWLSHENLGGIGTDHDILFSRSTDNGQNWTAPAALNSNAGSDSAHEWNPQVTTDGSGNWVAVWSSDENLGGIGIDGDILFSRSTDNGQNWTPEAALNSNAVSDSGTDWDPQVTADGSGNWVAVWWSDENVGGIGTDDDILFSRSIDNGQNWTAPAALNSNAGSDSEQDWDPQVTTDGSGNWVAVWNSRENLGGIGTDADILFSRSTDNGQNWTAPAALNTNAGSDSGDDYAPQMTTDGSGNWVAVWRSEENLGGIGTDDDILFSRSTDNGQNWTAPAALNSNAGSDSEGDYDPQVTTDGSGNWVAVWYSGENVGGTIGTDADILFATSLSDFGDAPDPSYPTLLASNGARHTIVSGGPILGSAIDDETDGQPTAAADGDDLAGSVPDDDDGVTFGSIMVGQLGAQVTVAVTNGPAKLDGWIDFNGDGSWGGPMEQIFDSVDVAAGDNVLTFDVPSWAADGPRYARFRLSTAGDLGHGGPAADGEVEDYQVTIDPPAVSSGTFGAQNTITTDADGACSVFAADMDGDGDTDVLSASLFDNKIAWYENDGSQSFTAHTISTDADEPLSVFAADVDGDGDIDVLSASNDDDKIAWYANDGSGNFGPQSTISSAAQYAESVFAADLDGDGDTDVLSASVGDDKIAWYENDGSGNFGAQKTITTAADAARSVFAADVDGDGDIDVLSASQNDQKIAWYANDGSGNFGAQKTISTASATPNCVFAADLDGDGDTDVLSASWQDDKIAWYENDGSQNFAAHTIATTADFSLTVFAADVDGDGDTDVLSASFEDDKIAWYENDGSGNFGAQKTITTAAQYAESVFAADVDGDGDIDVLSASQGDDKIAWYENLNLDFGDAPDPLVATSGQYPTLLASDGARHVIVPGFHLGSSVDDEPEGQPDANATGDDNDGNDDDDGVTLTGPLVPGMGATFTVTASAAGKLDAWIDHDQDGVWEAGEQIANNQALNAGSNSVSFTVPALASNGATFARFRFSSAGGLSPDGLASDGEVEDYLFTIESVTDLGPVDFRDLPALDPSSQDLWYRLETTQAGFLTVQADYAPAGGAAALELYDQSGSLLDSSLAGSGQERVEHTAGGAGEVYFFKLGGPNNNVRVRICNLVDRTGTTVTASGTTGNDEYQLRRPGTNYHVIVKEIVYEFTTAQMTAVNFEGEGGSDTYDLALVGVPVGVNDTGGSNDTLDFAAAGRGITVNLSKAAGQVQRIARRNRLTITGTIETCIGTDYNDKITGNDADNTLEGGRGNDTLLGNNGDDTLRGGNGRDTLRGQMGDDELFGGEGNDRLFGHHGNDVLQGEEGNDTLGGGTGDDELLGGEGNDRLFGHHGNDVLQGDEGNDTLGGGTGDDQLRGGQGNDRLFGHQGNDIVLGEGGNDQVHGGRDRDILIGGLGRDRLRGHASDDVLIGGTTVHDANDAALLALLAEWTQATPIDDRIDHLENGSGLNDPHYLNRGTQVLDDATRDRLYGGRDPDWFLSDPGDRFADRGSADR